MLIENDTDAKGMLTFLFENNGYEVVQAGKQISAEEVHQVNPNLVIVDYTLGETSGSEVCSKLKASTLTGQIPVVLYSPTLEVEKMSKGMADALFAKPYELEDLVWLVSRIALNN